MKIRLLVDCPYLGSAGNVVEVKDADAIHMITNRIAEAPDAKSAEVLNRRFKADAEYKTRVLTSADSSDF